VSDRASTLGVGFIGAGPVVQSIHLPALARHADRFSVVHVNDISAEAAQRVADRVGARSSTDLQELLDDPRVDVVAVCSPHQFHAEQVILAFQAGKKAVLCEKPLAMSTEEAARIASASAEYGVPLIVGAMHHYDAGWMRAWDAWSEAGQTAHTIRSSIVLPPNVRFEDFAVEPLAPPSPPPSRGESNAERAASVGRGVLGLAVHDLPLIRALAGGAVDPTVLWAESMRDMGYRVVFRLGETTVDMLARIYGTWRPQWSLEALSLDAALRVEFTPSYVLAGSATSSIDRAGRAALHFARANVNGYEGEWLHLADVVDGAALRHPPADLIDDLTLALALADKAQDWIASDELAGLSEVS
jgi:predicted dehydrogenase